MEGKKQRLLDLIYPPCTCAVCGNELEEEAPYQICTACYVALEFNNGRTCEKCGRRVLTLAGVCNHCRYEAFPFARAASAFCYEGQARKLLHRFKFRDERYLGEIFAAHMAEKYHAAHLEADVMTPVPMRPAALWSRGYNQAELLAKKLSPLLGLPVGRFLKKTRPTPHQSQLNAAERRRNLEGAYRPLERQADGVRGRKILLVDDVLTTGATAAACAAALLKSGAAAVYVLTACSTTESLGTPESPLPAAPGDPAPSALSCGGT